MEALPGAADAISDGEGYLATLNGRLFYCGGLGWGAEYHDFSKFRGRDIAKTVSIAKVSVLEDGAVDDIKRIAEPPPAEAHAPRTTLALTEVELRGEIVPGTEAFHWLTVDQGPLDGVVWATVVLDSEGHVQSVSQPVADNGAMVAAAAEGFKAMRFRPVVRNGVATQATGRVSVLFHTTRPTGGESLPSARELFRTGRNASSFAEAANKPYELHAKLQFSGTKEIGTAEYRDVWPSANEWRREAKSASSLVVRARTQDTWYRREDGPDAGVLKLLVMAIEPIPADDTMTESDWRVRRETLRGQPALRVIRGPEFPDTANPSGKQSQAFWFAADGRLLQTYTSGLVIRPINFHESNGKQMPSGIQIVLEGHNVAKVDFYDVAAPSLAVKGLQEKGHEWKRAFTGETR